MPQSNPATKDFCAKQVKRLAITPLFRPSTEQAVKDWVSVLLRHCRSDEHAEAVMTEFIEHTTESENPLADVVQIAARLDPRKQLNLPDACTDCAPYGGSWRIVSRSGVEGSERCDCLRGRRLSELDALRVPPQPRKPARLLERPGVDWAQKAAGDREL